MNTTALLIVGLPMLCLVFIAVAGVFLLSRSINESNRKKEIWPKFAVLIGGTFTEGTTGQSDSIFAHVDEDPLYLDTYVYGANHAILSSTRMRAFYRALIPFELTVCSSDMLEVAQINRAEQQIDVALSGLSPEFRVYGNDRDRITELLDDELVRLISAARPIDLRIRRRRNWKNEGTSNSIYEVHALKFGLVTELSDLISMHQLVGTCIQRLHTMNIAGRLVDANDSNPNYLNRVGTNAE